MAVTENSKHTYQEIEDEGLRQTREDLVYNYIKTNPGLTGREIAQGLGYSDMNEVRPRITDLFNKGLILYGEKKYNQDNKRPSSQIFILKDFEQYVLFKLGFQKKCEGLYYFETPEYILYQDFRGTKRKSYAFDVEGNGIDHSHLEIHKAFKKLMEVLGRKKNGFRKKIINNKSY